MPPEDSSSSAPQSNGVSPSPSPSPSSSSGGSTHTITVDEKGTIVMTPKDGYGRKALLQSSFVGARQSFFVGDSSGGSGGGGGENGSGGDPSSLLSPRSTSALVVMCHGLGDTATSFFPVAQRLAPSLPHAKIVVLQAPLRIVTVNMRRPCEAWYDLTSFSSKSTNECEGIEESRDDLWKILRTEHEEEGVAYDRMALVGFSMGAALCLYAGLTFDPTASMAETEAETDASASVFRSLKVEGGGLAATGGEAEGRGEGEEDIKIDRPPLRKPPASSSSSSQRIGGVAMLSGYLVDPPPPHQFALPHARCDTRSVPILHCHGMSDKRVQYSWATKSMDAVLEKFRMKDYRMRAYRGIGHEVVPREMDDLAEFLIEVLPPPPPEEEEDGKPRAKEDDVKGHGSKQESSNGRRNVVVIETGQRRGVLGRLLGRN